MAPGIIFDEFTSAETDEVCIKIMLRLLKYSFAVSEIQYREATLKSIDQYTATSKDQLCKLANFSSPAQSSIFSRIFSQGSRHTPLIKLYFAFLQQRKMDPDGMAYHYLEQTLRERSLAYLQSARISIVNTSAKIIKSQLLEKTEIMGLFIHRKYNLNHRSYNIEMKKPDCAVCTLKNTLRSEAVNAFEKNIREFKKDSMDKVYGKSFIDFTANCTISRYMYKMSMELQLSLSIPKQGTITLGKEGPTNHLVQIESFFNPVSNIEEYYLTDFDFFLGGNSFFREGLAF